MDGHYLALYIYLDQPIGHFIDKISNYLVYERKGPERMVGKLLFRSGLADDWNTPPVHVKKNIKPNPLITAANSVNQYPYQLYDDLGHPLGLKPGLFLPPSNHHKVNVNSSNELLSAIRRAKEGDIITLSPGIYRLNGRSIPITRAGSASSPIYVRSEQLGAAKLEMNMLEGFHIRAPYWVFENLDIRGVCNKDSNCEHAFHVVSKGSSFTLRNSKLVDFNAPIKVNGAQEKKKDYFPDKGLLEYNLFANTKPRKTSNPVTLVNINSVNNWVVRGNFIADFSKGGGDHVSYGAFMKGNSANGLFERNLVICEHKVAADRGIRIGLSFGGGATGRQFCRNRDCTIEHSNGVMRNNIILNCSHDVGIYLNKAANSRIYNNLLHNNLGIDVRFPTSSALVTNNIISGRIKDRDGGISHADNNHIDRNCVGNQRRYCGFDSLYSMPDIGDFRLSAFNNPIQARGNPIDELTDDFCGNPRTSPIDLGPIQYSQGHSCLQP